MIRYAVIYLLLFISLNSFAQPIQVYVMKGKVEIRKRTVFATLKDSISKGEVLETFSNSVVLARKGKKIIYLSKAKKYTYTDINAMFKPSVRSSSGLLKVLHNYNPEIKQEAGVTMRGESDISDPTFYLPADSFIVLNQPVKLIIGKDINGPSSEVIVYRFESADTIKLPAGKTEYVLSLNEPGMYYWEYSTRGDGKSYKFKNNFIIPTQEEKQQILAAIINFKVEISAFDQETQILLLDEYYKFHRLYGMD